MERHPYRLINDAEEIQPLVERLRQAPVIGIDTETTGLDPFQSRLRLLQLAVSEEVAIIDCFQLTREELQPLAPLLAAPRPVKVAHNAKFDGKFLRYHLGMVLEGLFDTYLASLLLSAGSETDRHGLEPVVARYLNRAIDKQAQRSDWSGPLTAAQLEYAASDAAILLPLYDVMREWLDKADLLVVADIEFDCLRSVIGLELNGAHLDVERWRRLIDGMRAELAGVESELQAALSGAARQFTLFGDPEPINLDSPSQVREALAHLGIEIEDTREWRLQKLAPDHPIVATLLRHRHLSKNLSAFGDNILEMINPVTGRLHPDYRQIGTPTGRMTSGSPSLQQVPHSVEYRSCFRAPAGYQLIVADYSQIEMRILADFSRDEALLNAFDHGADLHRQTAADMFGLPLDQITQRQREYAKGLNYGLIYGMGAEGLASRLDASVAEATSLIERYFAAYPGVARWLEEAARRAVDEGKARTASGRLWIFRLDPQDPQQQAALRRVGKNAPIQGTASDIFKRAIRLLEEALEGLDARLVNAIHDELVVEVATPIAAEVEQLVGRTMVASAREFLTRVPVEVDVVIADAWLKGK
jgi:DNA polymerase I